MNTYEAKKPNESDIYGYPSSSVSDSFILKNVNSENEKSLSLK